jgi:Zn-dependent metalloprotease
MNKDINRFRPSWRANLRVLLGLVLVSSALAITVSPGGSALAATDAQRTASAYLTGHAAELGLKADLSDLQIQLTAATLGGSVVSFKQYAGGWPVDAGEVKVTLDKTGNVLMVASSYKALTSVQDNRGEGVGADKAASAAQAYIVAMTPSAGKAGAVRKDRIVIADGSNAGRQAWRVDVEAQSGEGAWEVMVDAYTGQVLSSRDLRLYDTGTGRVFNPNPMATSLDTTLTDNDDQDYPALTAQLQQVTLLGLDSRGYLDGQFVTTSPSQGTRAFSREHVYNYTRSDARFEEVMAYYHIDTTQRYIQSLGFNNVNNRAQPVKADAFSYDNSYYNPSNGRITLGRGGVDDAEDADVILHEYGHAIQDNQVYRFGSSLEAGSMGEGFGDYWAMTNFAQQQPRAWQPIIAEWDAVSYDSHNPPYLRRLDLDLHYPTDVRGEVHHDGQIWSRALWDMWNRLGKRTTDTLVLQSHFSLTPTASFRDGAMAIIAADRALNGGRNVNAIERIFADRGIATR